MAPESEHTALETLMSETVKQLFALIKDDLDEKKSKLAETLIDGTVQSLTKIASDKEQQLIESRVKNKVLEDKVSSLEKEVSSYKRYALSTQIEMIKGNVMIRTTKGPKDVADFVCKMVEKSGATKPSGNSFFIQQISTDIPNKDKSPTKPAKGDKAVPNLYKVHLGGKMKNELFKGLATITNTRSSSKDDFQVSHDVPPFLYKQRNLLEKAAYSLRKENKEIGVRTKVTLKGFNLVLFVRTKEATDWVSIENEKVSQLRATKLEAKEGDLTPPGDVASLLKSLEKF